MKVSVDFSWENIGVVFIELGSLRFPRAPESPGVYRFDFGQSVYIGETDRLPRRFQHYRTPGPSQHTNIRLKGRMLEHLNAGESVVVSIITRATINVDGVDSELDLTKKSSRLLLESAALSSVRITGQSVENL
jgi:multidrug efflux pump subunit AcrA (membrane-fusion protein)